MLIKKPPVIVILGHIDHGKTTLLDYIRKTNIALKETGGITQKIGAYEIEFNKEKITFIDTPGHSAFINLRQRGVKVADIGILVVAADEGVKDQTKESLEYLKLAKIPFMVVLTKVDKKEAEPQRVISQLVELDVIPEKWGGQVPLIEVSSKTGYGINDLLETIILLRDIYDLKAEIDVPGQGFVLETFKDPKIGILASLIVSQGRVNYGDLLLTATACCKIKILKDDLGNKIEFALPSKPVLVANWESLPLVGEEFEVGSYEKAKQIQERLKEKEEKFKSLLTTTVSFNEDFEGNYNYLTLVLKADNFGSLEAVINIFDKLAKENNLVLKIIKAEVGPIIFEDLKLVRAFDSFLVSFNVKNEKYILEEIKNLNLKFFESNLVYDLEEKFLAYLKIKKEEIVKGKLEVLAIFNKTRTKKTIGGRVNKGKICLGQRVIIIRENQEVGQGKIISLEKNKIPAKEVGENELCGLIIETLKDVQEKDILKVI